MLQAQNFFTAVYQATIFTPDTSAFSAPKLLATILGKYAHRYDGSVQALPLPENIPSEIPRVILQSIDGLFKLEASPARVNSLFMQNVDSLVEPKDLFSICFEVLEHYVKNTNMQVDRLALVLTRVHKTENPAQVLIEKFCKSELKSIFVQSENFEIHNHKQFQFKEFTVNSWIRCKTATLLSPNTETPVVVVEQDLNTLASETEQLRFASEDIRIYFDQALQEAQNILQLYFPN